MNKKRNNKTSFNNKIKKARERLKEVIDEMSNDEFIAFVFIITQYLEESDNELYEDEEEAWKDETENVYSIFNNDIKDFSIIDEDDLPF